MSSKAASVASCLLIVGAVFAQPSQASGDLWDTSALMQTPAMEWLDTSQHVHALLFDGLPYQGEPSRVYALYADPVTLAAEGHGSSETFPAIVLVHGGGGHAFPHWVEQWARRGYAALAMDLGSSENPSPQPGPRMGNQLAEWHVPPEDRWLYHAPANVVLAHSLLRSLPRTNPDQTAIMGISWGGFLTCLAAGLDDRFKAAVSIYGTGSLHQGTTWSGRFEKLEPQLLNEWRERWDPTAYLPSSKVPLLIVNGDSDPVFYLEATHRTAAIAPYAEIRIIPGLAHGHGAAFTLNEPGEFIDAHVLHRPPGAQDRPIVFVSPDGILGAEGTKHDPLPSLAAARDAVRALKDAHPESDITVYIRGGDYFIGETVTFTPEDSAQPGTTITYRSYRDERPVFSAGIPVTGWEQPTSFPEGLPEKTRDHVMVTSFPEGVASFLTLFDTDGRLPRTLGPEHKPALDRTRPEVADRQTLYFEPGAMRDYANLQDIEIWIVPTFQWCHNILPLESLDLDKGIARTRVMGTYALAQRERGYDPSRFRVANAPDYLNAPGQWFMDTRDRRLWLWPRNGETPEGVVIPGLQELLLLAGDPDTGETVSGLVFEGLTFKHNERDRIGNEDRGLQHDWEFWDKPNAMIRLRGAENCTVRGCLITHGGGGGIRLDRLARMNTIEGNEISYLGGTGLALIGDKVGRPMVNHGNRIHNNHIHRIALEHHHNPAVMVWQSGENRITHNRIHHTPYNGFSVGGVIPPHFSSAWRENNFRELTGVIDYSELPFQEMEHTHDPDITWPMILPYLYTRDNLFAYNRLYRNMEVLGDGNPFYIRMAGTGNMIRRNYFHDVYGSHSAGAMRFDGQQSGNSFVENIIFRCTGAGIAFHKANHIMHNVIVDILGNPQIAHGGRRPEGRTGADIETTAGFALRCTPGSGFPKVGIPNYDEALIHGNVMVQRAAAFEPFYGDTRHWEGRAPRWTDFRNVRNTDYNILWSPENPESLTEWMEESRAAGLDQNSQTADPLFMDLEQRDFRFQGDSPARLMGIPSLDRREMDLTADFPAWLADRLREDYDEPLVIEGLNSP